MHRLPRKLDSTKMYANGEPMSNKQNRVCLINLPHKPMRIKTLMKLSSQNWKGYKQRYPIYSLEKANWTQKTTSSLCV
ncbi:hypothetical protein BBOMB_1475 [Bifidobacterium bombi DSM 19703]|uniref:Uncharacterized protein n=1 Tax=Bifidobacterium bombi DSM 19703 TaxID=1341695 RepID=A0A086BNU8_9BIFI|nr:hypothetical protein BBOMB_1475 [Bifidobacterium bombi DSM 19703]